jgi:hypothetical protein
MKGGKVSEEEKLEHDGKEPGKECEGGRQYIVR